MTYQKPLHKDRVPVYCSQCHDEIRVQCPVCRLTKIPRHCKVFKNIAALWWHLKQDHGKFAYSQFNSDDVCKVLNNLTKAIRWGIIQNV